MNYLPRCLGDLNAKEDVPDQDSAKKEGKLNSTLFCLPEQSRGMVGNHLLARESIYPTVETIQPQAPSPTQKRPFPLPTVGDGWSGRIIPTVGNDFARWQIMGHLAPTSLSLQF